MWEILNGFFSPEEKPSCPVSLNFLQVNPLKGMAL
jgi:hypothetical protein